MAPVEKDPEVFRTDTGTAIRKAVIRRMNAPGNDARHSIE